MHTIVKVSRAQAVELHGKVVANVLVVVEARVGPASRNDAELVVLEVKHEALDALRCRVRVGRQPHREGRAKPVQLDRRRVPGVTKKKREGEGT